MADSSAAVPDIAFVADIYDNQAAVPLRAIREKTQALLERLAALDPVTKQFIDDAIQKHALTQRQNEAYVAPDTLEALAPLARHMQALDEFFQAAKDGKSELTVRQQAAGLLRWEPFDQFQASIAVLHHVLTDQEFGHLALPEEEARPIIELAKQLRKDCDRLGDALAGQKDNQFLGAVDALSGHAPAPAALLPAEGDLNALYRSQLAGPLDSVMRNTERLLQLWNNLPVEETQWLEELGRDYEEKCTLDAGAPPTLHRIHDELDNLHNLDTVFRLLGSEKTRELTPGEKESAKAVTDNAWQTVNRLRMPVRAMNALLLAHNAIEEGQGHALQADREEPGMYDEMLRLASAVTANCWKVQNIIREHELNPALKAAVAEYNQRPLAPPPTEIDGATATAVKPPYTHGK